MKLESQISYARKKAQEGHLPLSRQLFEMTLLYTFRRLGPGFYLFARYWRKCIPLQHKLRNLNEKSFYRKIAKINNLDYRKLSQHKVAEKALLSLFSIPTPRFWGFLHKTNGLSCRGARLCNAEDMKHLLNQERPNVFCLKQVEGWSGSGFRAVRVLYAPNGPTLESLKDGKQSTIEDYFQEQQLLSVPGGLLMEEYLAQHPWYHSINPSSVNTIRMYANTDAGRNIYLIGGYLRAGRQGSIVDNVSAGGYFWPFDVRTGVLSVGRADAYDSDEYASHPDSGIQLEGCTLPMYDQVCDLSKKALSIFPHTAFAGLDIAITPDGPAVIELNVVPDKTCGCDIDMPMLDMMGLE
jgi:hypothetical protein